MNDLLNISTIIHEFSHFVISLQSVITSYANSDSLLSVRKVVSKVFDESIATFFEYHYIFIFSELYENSNYNNKENLINRFSSFGEQYFSESYFSCLKNKNYNEVIRISSAIPSNQLSKDEQYLLGLAFLGLGNYKEAENYLGLDSVYALYYTAISQYAQGKNTESYNNFLKVTQEYPAHRLGIESHIYAAKCCIISKDYENAEKQARFAINKSINASQKSEAALLLANLYQEQGKYQEGISLLYLIYTILGNQEEIKKYEQKAIANGIRKSQLRRMVKRYL